MKPRFNNRNLPFVEGVFLQLLPKEKFPIFIRYAVSTGIVGVFALLRYSLDTQLKHYPVLLFFPAIFLCSLLFDRGSGLFATMLSAIIAAYLFISPQFSFEISGGDLTALFIFVLVGCTMAIMIEALRKTVENLAHAEKSKSLLLEELAHRTKNDLAIIASAITLQARAAGNDDVRLALESANARVQVIAAAQSLLHISDGGAEIELNKYLQALCNGLGDMLRGIRPIAVRVVCPAISLNESTAVAIGLIVNELVTNSFKYAFPTDRGGSVDVNIATRQGGGLVVNVRDDGAGCSDGVVGLGTRLVNLLTKQHGGSFERLTSGGGCEAVAVIPNLA